MRFRDAAGIKPCWIVWEAASDGGRPYLIAVDTSKEQANHHARARREEAQRLDKPPPQIVIEESWLDHLYGESMTVSFDEIKQLMHQRLSVQVTELKTRLARAIELAREGFTRGWADSPPEGPLAELEALEKAL